MSDHRQFRVSNTLAHIGQNGGMLISEALSAGNLVMKEMRKPCLRTIDRLMLEMNRRYGPSSRQADGEFEGLYQLSAQVIDVSGPVADLQVDKAAFSLCELVDRCAGQGAWDWPSVDVHLDALQLLRHAPLEAAERRKILSGLMRLIERLPAAMDDPDAAEQA